MKLQYLIEIFNIKIDYKFDIYFFKDFQSIKLLYISLRILFINFNNDYKYMNI